jgi:hypothetical protein
VRFGEERNFFLERRFLRPHEQIADQKRECASGIREAEMSKQDLERRENFFWKDAF